MSFKIHFRCGNPPLCRGVIAVPSGPKSNTFTVILAVFPPQQRWQHKLWKGLLRVHFLVRLPSSTRSSETGFISWQLTGSLSLKYVHRRGRYHPFSLNIRLKQGGGSFVFTIKTNACFLFGIGTKQENTLCSLGTKGMFIQNYLCNHLRSTGDMSGADPVFLFFFCRIPVVLENRRSSQGGGGFAAPAPSP